MLFPSVQLLGIQACHDIRSLNDFSAIKDVTDLRRCWIENCDGIECVLPSWINNPVIQTLEYLGLYGLHKLDGLFEANVIVKSSPPDGIFSSLKVVVIWHCGKIKKLFPTWKLVEYLQCLESVVVGHCYEMEEIIGSHPKKGGESGDIIKKFILPNLKNVRLTFLPALKSICSRRVEMVCDSLEDILIRNCNDLRRIPFHLPPSLILYELEYLDRVSQLIAMLPPQPSTFSSLKQVKISGCERAKKLFPSWKLVKYLQILEEISVKKCEKMEEIIGSDPGEEGDIIKECFLPKLKSLTLVRLPALKSICSRRVVMVCDSLEEIVVRDCKSRRITFCLPRCLTLYGFDYLVQVFGVELIAMSPPQPCTFSSLKEIEILRCKGANKLLPSWEFVEYLQNLESIEVCKCEEMEEIIGSDPEEGEGGDIIKKLILPKLKTLGLQKLPALKSICSKKVVMVCDSLEMIVISHCKGLRRIPFRLPPRLYLMDLDDLDWVFEEELIAMSPPQPSSFSSLKEIEIWRCKEANKLLPSWKFVEYLQNLESIEVCDCKEMEEIIGSDPEEGEEGGDIIKKLILPKLKTLRLQRLPALKSICSKKVVMVCDSLEMILISHCNGLRRIPFRLPPRLTLEYLDNLDWVFEVELIAMSPPQPCTFSFIKEVQIRECKRAKRLFPSWKSVECLQNLESINVYRCEEMEEIIASDPEEEGEGGGIIKKLILPKLKYLRVAFLPALKSICSRRAVMVCDSLEHIDTMDCDGLRRIPLYFPLLDNAQPSLPPSLKKIEGISSELWELLEWDQPNAKDVLQPLVQSQFPSSESEQSEPEQSESEYYLED
ncbi:hypothetical protein SLA2020_074150 [Shorea laevis]